MARRQQEEDEHHRGVEVDGFGAQERRGEARAPGQQQQRAEERRRLIARVLRGVEPRGPGRAGRAER